MPTLSGVPVISLSGPRLLRLIVGLVVLLMAGGCAKQKSDPGYYELPAGSSATDAASQARNTYNRGVVSAPSQIQLDLNANERIGLASSDTPDAAAPVDQASIIPQPQTYQGTLPCFHRELNCTARRITVTLAPNGRWRARVGYLDAAGQSGSDLLDQGCWRAIADRQARFLLIGRNGNVFTEMSMVQSNVLRVRSVNGEALSLAYNLMRQSDLDPIDALPGTPAPACD